jgi:hypothetical protein
MESELPLSPFDCASEFSRNRVPLSGPMLWGAFPERGAGASAEIPPPPFVVRVRARTGRGAERRSVMDLGCKLVAGRTSDRTTRLQAAFFGTFAAPPCRGPQPGGPRTRAVADGIVVQEPLTGSIAHVSLDPAPVAERARRSPCPKSRFACDALRGPANRLRHGRE